MSVSRGLGRVWVEIGTTLPPDGSFEPRAASSLAHGVASGHEGRGDRIRRPPSLLGLVVQPRHRRLAGPPADRLGRGRGDRASSAGPLAERVPDAQGSGGRRLPRRDHGPRAVRRAPARPGERRARPCLRPPGALRGQGRLPTASAFDRALRARRPPRGSRAPQGQARCRRSSSPRSASGLSPASPAHRPRHRERCCSQARSRDRDHRPVPTRSVLVAETYVQGPRAPVAIIEALRTICEARRRSTSS